MPFDATPITNPVVEMLQKVYDLISPRGRWLRQDLAQTYKGKSVDVDDDRAYRFCLIGAANKLQIDSLKLASALGFNYQSDMMYFNDHSRKQTVMAHLKDSIEKAKGL